MVQNFIFPVISLIAAELFLRYQNPYRLWKDAFDESLVCEPDGERGWRPKPNIEFNYYHRYMRGKRRIKQNSLGLRSSNNYDLVKNKDTYRVLIFGDSTLQGWELEEDQTIHRLVENGIANELQHKKVEVIPVAARNYCLGQLFTWYKSVFHEFDYDLLIYYFNENNPRRTITFHESGKPTLLTQPVFVWSEDNGLSLCPPPTINHPNDMVYLDQNGKTVVDSGNTIITPHVWMREHLHIYCALTDLIQGPIRLRKFMDRYEIKNIEKWNTINDATEKRFPYQWEICRRIFKEWIRLARGKQAQFVIIPNLQYYHAGNNWLLTGTKHEYGFNYEDIPCREYLRLIAVENEIEFFDTYQFVYENRIDTGNFYVHPRYAFHSSEGARFQTSFILKSISSLKNGKKVACKRI